MPCGLTSIESQEIAWLLFVKRTGVAKGMLPSLSVLQAPGINPSASCLREKGSVPDRQQQQKQVF